MEEEKKDPREKEGNIIVRMLIGLIKLINNIFFKKDNN